MAGNQEAAVELTELGVATLHEASDRRGLLRGLRLLVGPRFAGRACTVWIPAGDNLGIHRALARAEPGSVVCVASCGQGDYGVFGELLMALARQRSVAAVVLEDGCRDLEELRYPPALAATGGAVQGTVKRRVLSQDSPVAIGGVLISPGDWVVGDRDGVIAIPIHLTAHVVTAAHLRVEKETKVREAVGMGATVLESLTADLTAIPGGTQ